MSIRITFLEFLQALSCKDLVQLQYSMYSPRALRSCSAFLHQCETDWIERVMHERMIYVKGTAGIVGGPTFAYFYHAGKESAVEI